MRFARVVFTVAGIYGLIVLAPQYFLIETNGRAYPPAITHPEYYYGFLGVGIAWQIAFLLIARDPARYRPLMLASIVEKASFGIVACVLFAQRRLGASMFGAGLIDLILGTLFLASWSATGRTEPRGGAAAPGRHGEPERS